MFKFDPGYSNVNTLVLDELDAALVRNDLRQIYGLLVEHGKNADLRQIVDVSLIPYFFKRFEEIGIFLKTINDQNNDDAGTIEKFLEFHQLAADVFSLLAGNFPEGLKQCIQEIRNKFDRILRA